jgi:hypothetical protein
MSDLFDDWSDDQREAVQEFCLRACRTLWFDESRGDSLETINRMLAVARLAHLTGVPDEQELGDLISAGHLPGLWT